MNGSLILVLSIGALFLLLVCLTQLQCNGFCFVLLYFILLCLLLSLSSLCFSDEKLLWMAGEVGRSRGKGNGHQYILYEKKNQFLIKDRRSSSGYLLQCQHSCALPVTRISSEDSVPPTLSYRHFGEQWVHVGHKPWQGKPHTALATMPAS